MSKLQEFYLLRERDVSGVSGLGVVARGIELPSSRVVLEWLGPPHKTLGLYDNLKQVKEIHGHGNATKLVLGTPSKKLLAKKK